MWLQDLYGFVQEEHSQSCVRDADGVFVPDLLLEVHHGKAPVVVEDIPLVRLVFLGVVELHERQPLEGLVHTAFVDQEGRTSVVLFGQYPRDGDHLVGAPDVLRLEWLVREDQGGYGQEARKDHQATEQDQVLAVVASEFKIHRTPRGCYRSGLERIAKCVNFVNSWALLEVVFLL